ncbi:MAG: lysophospholipid acyltransferase family protein [Chloroflexi bacterium]|nr:lysophospholipid acyltransferase family protein [Chloroflexota bacterium]
MLATSQVAGRLPSSVLYSFADVMGDVVYWGWPRGRRNTIANMRHVLGHQAQEGEVRRVSRHSFRNYLRLMADFARTLRSPQEYLDHRVQVSGWETLDAAIEQGKGTILVGLHMGNWDLAGLTLASNGYKVNAVMESFASPQVDHLVRSTRESWGIRCIPLRSMLRPIYESLRRNEIVGLVTDRPAGPEGAVVQFFGSPSRWPIGPAALAVRTGAQIVPGYLVRRPDNTFVGKFLSLPPVPQTGDRQHDVQQLTQAIVTTLEEPIRKHPEQWFMFRRMWDDPLIPNKT